MERLLGQLKDICANVCSMGKKQEELEAIMCQKKYDTVAITEMWWDVSHEWSAIINVYTFFRKDRQGR